MVSMSARIWSCIGHFSLGSAKPCRGSGLWTFSWCLSICTCGWFYVPGGWWWSRYHCGYLDCVHRNLLCLACGGTLCVGIHRLWCCFWRYTIEVLSLLSGRFLVSRSCYGGQVSVRAGLVGVIPGLGLLSGCNSDHRGPAASSTAV